MNESRIWPFASSLQGDCIQQFIPLIVKQIDPDQSRITERGAAIDLYQRATSWPIYPDIAKPQTPRFLSREGESDVCASPRKSKPIPASIVD
jgi:hypothetical protein